VKQAGFQAETNLALAAARQPTDPFADGSTALHVHDVGRAADIVGVLGWCAGWTARDEALRWC
jgi:hypothetical protein